MTAAERPAAPGELCTCGRPARAVYATQDFGEVGWCGLSDGGRRGPCAFCGARAGHDVERCPAYRLRPDRGDAPDAGTTRSGAPTAATDGPGPEL